MLVFISLLVYLEMKNRLGDKFTVEGASIETGNLMCKSYEDKTIICEPTKNMKAIAKSLGYMASMKLEV